MENGKADPSQVAEGELTHCRVRAKCNNGAAGTFCNGQRRNPIMRDEVEAQNALTTKAKWALRLAESEIDCLHVELHESLDREIDIRANMGPKVGGR